MRQCMYEANLIDNSGTQNLKFSTEPEAAAVHCMKELNQHVAKNWRTIDLTVRKLLDSNQLGEDTECSGDFCG
ncbi:12884_t:CDS:2, partial [Gigaspora rosea]